MTFEAGSGKGLRVFGMAVVLIALLFKIIPKNIWIHFDTTDFTIAVVAGCFILVLGTAVPFMEKYLAARGKGAAAGS